MAEDKATTFRKQFETLDFGAPTLQIEAGKTLVPTPSVAMKAVDTIPEMRTTDEPVDLAFAGMLGEGGMGIVHLARQTSLERDVAVKTLKVEHDVAVQGLLQEAYVTGHLEHPNIIPVYTLGKDAKGRPLLVMKRVEGVSWLDVLTGHRSPGGEKADLNWHLKVLVDVCDALRFAHSRGIVHRDVKPENVMLGEFGETYLLDWGIALQVSDQANDSRFPHRSQSHGVAGTPAYMAPEMTSADANQIDERTDVYLLGACLHEIVTGHPRHQGDTLFEIMFSAFDSSPFDYDETVPAELAQIANRATAAHKSNRYESVHAFQQALENYLEHRAANEMVKNAEAALARIDAQESDQRLEAFLEARIGFQQAKRLWADSPDADKGLQNCMERMARWHLERSEIVLAADALRVAPFPNAELQAEIDLATSRLDDERAELEALKHFARDFDPRSNLRARAVLLFILVMIWSASTLYSHFTIEDPMQPLPFEAMVYGILRTVILPAVLSGLAYRWVVGNRTGKRILVMLWGTLASMTAVRAIGTVSGVPLVLISSMEAQIYGLALIGLGAIADKRLGYVGPVYFVAGLLGPVYPAYRMVFMSVAHMVLALAVIWVWGLKAPKTAKS